MPVKSKAQLRLMAGAANSPAFSKKVGVSKSVAKEFVKATKSAKTLPEKVKKKR